MNEIMKILSIVPCQSVDQIIHRAQNESILYTIFHTNQNSWVNATIIKLNRLAHKPTQYLRKYGQNSQYLCIDIKICAKFRNFRWLINYWSTSTWILHFDLICRLFWNKYCTEKYCQSNPAKCRRTKNINIYISIF